MKASELKNLPIGTKIRVKDSVKCHEMYKRGGILVKQNEITAKKEGEYTFGIDIGQGVCYQFEAKEYKLIEQ